MVMAFGPDTYLIFIYVHRLQKKKKLKGKPYKIYLQIHWLIFSAERYDPVQDQEDPGQPEQLWRRLYR